VQEFDYRRAIGRIEKFTVFLAVTGTIAIGLIMDSRHALGFGAGSLLAYLSFLLIKRLANALAPHSDLPSRRETTAGLVLRYAVIGATVFGIMKFTGIGAWPVFAGLLTTVAAVIAEVVYELVTA
jgi:hypothetical protein